MASVNPPADAEQADSQPQIVLSSGGAQARIGRLTFCDTLPGPCAFRYVVLDTGDGRQFRGYLWET
jgi:hypothetical protein